MNEEWRARLKLIAAVIGLSSILVLLGYATFDEWSALVRALLGT